MRYFNVVYLALHNYHIIKFSKNYFLERIISQN